MLRFLVLAGVLTVVVAATAATREAWSRAAPQPTPVNADSNRLFADQMTLDQLIPRLTSGAAF